MSKRHAGESLKLVADHKTMMMEDEKMRKTKKMMENNGASREWEFHYKNASIFLSKLELAINLNTFALYTPSMLGAFLHSRLLLGFFGNLKTWWFLRWSFKQQLSTRSQIWSSHDSSLIDTSWGRSNCQRAPRSDHEELLSRDLIRLLQQPQKWHEQFSRSIGKLVISENFFDLISVYNNLNYDISSTSDSHRRQWRGRNKEIQEEDRNYVDWREMEKVFLFFHVSSFLYKFWQT